MYIFIVLPLAETSLQRIKMPCDTYNTNHKITRIKYTLDHFYLYEHFNVKLFISIKISKTCLLIQSVDIAW